MSQKRNKNNRKKQNEQDIVQTDRNVSEVKVDNDTEAQLLQELEDIGKEQLQDISSRVRALIGSDKEAVRNFNSQRRKEQEEKQKEEKAKEKAKEKAANEREAKEKEEKQREEKQREEKQREEKQREEKQREEKQKEEKAKGKAIKQRGEKQQEDIQNEENKQGQKQKEVKRHEQQDLLSPSKKNEQNSNNRRNGKDRGKNKNTQSGVRDLAFQDFDIRNLEESEQENPKKKMGVKPAELRKRNRELPSDIDKEIDEEIDEEIELQIEAEELRKQRALDEPDERDDFLGNLARKEVPKSQQKIRKKTPDRLKRDIPVQKENGFLESIRTLALKGAGNAAAIVSIVALFVILSVALILDRNNVETGEHTVFKTTGVTKAEKLIENYYAALESKDVENVRGYLYNGEQISDEDITTRIHQNSYFIDNGIVENHKVVKGYLVDGLRDKEYVLFLKYSLKISNIKTEAVGIQTYYIIDVSEEGKAIDYRICASLEEGSEYLEYVNEVSNTKEIKKLLKEVNDELSEACENDEELNNLVNILLTGSADTDNTQEDDSTTKGEDESETEGSTTN